MFLTMEGSVSRIFLAITITIVTLGFIDSANATNSRAQGKAGQRAMCQDKIGPKHLSGDPMKAEWKKCMEDANAYQ
jgi:hypothetical protein